MNIGLVSVVFVPIILLLNVKPGALNIDVLASIISIIAIRSFVFGTTTKFYALDFVFGLAVLLVVFIPMIKIIILTDSSGEVSESNEALGNVSPNNK